MSDRDPAPSDHPRGLIPATGLDLSEAETKALIAIYERYAGSRSALASATLGETEPATTFQAPSREERK